MKAMVVMVMMMMMVMTMMIDSQESQVRQLEAVGVDLGVCAGALPASAIGLRAGFEAPWYPNKPEDHIQAYIELRTETFPLHCSQSCGMTYGVPLSC